MMTSNVTTSSRLNVECMVHSDVMTFGLEDVMTLYV